MTMAAAPNHAPLVVNGWSDYAHLITLDRPDALIKEVEVCQARAPTWQIALEEREGNRTGCVGGDPQFRTG